MSVPEKIAETIIKESINRGIRIGNTLRDRVESGSLGTSNLSMRDKAYLGKFDQKVDRVFAKHPNLTLEQKRDFVASQARANSRLQRIARSVNPSVDVTSQKKP
jgi:hypothetical protein